ncbi:hypothetical protein SAMN03159341_101452 [Paenibacillus sp. 1_12]|uniref:hypothetical protein n=1 Tax=Paenibacillus sp. 1_12 TaxID=1566278 RepID=UPI0008EB23D3|nr:hypothetical protein [Paenibacillus sp. 1_12]SFK76109.1 hypothetical protein SAMN03159341_101452 [Paenibacillus sp. 1_12]
MYLRIIISLIIFLVLSACNAETEKTINDVASNLKDQASNIIDMENSHVLSVKNGHFKSSPDQSIGDAFQKFFGDPTWKYFKSDSGKDVVEFTGHMIYQEAKVKARFQFILNEDNSFEGGALSFNEVPQNALTKAALLSTIFDNKKDKNGDSTKVNQSADNTAHKVASDAGNVKQPTALEASPTSKPSDAAAPPTPTKKTLPSSLSGGKIPEIPSGIGDSMITLFKSNGKVINEVDTGSGLAYVFSNVVYYTTSRLSVNGNIQEGEVVALRFLEGHSILGIKIGSTPKVIVEKLGEPNSSGYSDLDGKYTLTYKFGDYILYISAPDKASPTTEALYKKD